MKNIRKMLITVMPWTPLLTGLSCHNNGLTIIMLMFESTPHIINFKQINLHDLQLEWKAVWILISRPRRSQLIRIYTAPQQNVGFTKCILLISKRDMLCVSFNIDLAISNCSQK